MKDAAEEPSGAPARVRRIRKHTELDVYRRAFEAAMLLFRLSDAFPAKEQYSLTDQVRRSSRSVCANLAEAWRKRRYPAAFVSKLSDSESEAAETQVWIEFAVRCNYLSSEVASEVYREYDEIVAMLVSMIRAPQKWTL
ncbi:MAG: four helix bundle protein [Pirellula sp.]|nr:four helix bundle protein [Pirellula sp.]